MKYVTNRALLSALALALGAAACSGGGKSSSLVPPNSVVNTPPTTLKTDASVTFTVTVPPATSTSSKRRSPRYISQSAAAIGIQIATANGAQYANTSTTVIPLVAGGANCSPSSAGTVCTGTVPAVVGTDTFVVNEYAAQDGSGPSIGGGNVTTQVSSGSSVALGNTVPVTLSALLDHLAVVLNPATVTAGTAATIALSVEPKDPSNATIIGQDFGPFQVAVNGGTGVLTYAPTPTASGAPYPFAPFTLTLAQQAAPVTVAYSGASNAFGTYTYHAQVVGTSYVTGSGTLTIGGVPTPPPVSSLPQRIYVLNAPTSASAFVTIYELTANGNVAPVRTVQLPATLAVKSGNPIAVGTSGEAAVVGTTNGQPVLYRIDPTATAPAANPLNNHTATDFTKTTLPQSTGYFVAIDAQQNIWTSGVSAVSGIGGSTTTPTTANGMLEYRPQASAGDWPIDAWTNSNMSGIAGGVIDPNGNFEIIANSATYEFRPGLTGPNASAIASTGFTFDDSIAADGAGNVYWLMGSQQRVTLANAAALSGGDIYSYGLPSATSPGHGSIAVAGGVLYATNPATNSVISLPAVAASGYVTPTTTISGAATLLNNPVGVAIGPSGP